MPAPKKKAQVSVYLDPDVMRSLSVYAARREQPMSLIAEAAIASFLSPDADERREAAIAKRLDQQDRRLARLGLAPTYGAANPFPVMAMQDVPELANFFERRVSAYQVGVQGEVAFDMAF